MGPGAKFIHIFMALKMMLGFIRQFPLSHFELRLKKKILWNIGLKCKTTDFTLANKRSQIKLKLVSLTNPDVIYAW